MKIKPPEWFDSSDDYYDQFIQPWEKKLEYDLENGLIDSDIFDIVIDEHWEDFTEIIVDRYYDDLVKIYREHWEMLNGP
jgi:hypothetical protein